VAKISNIDKFEGFLDHINKIEKYTKYQATFGSSRVFWIGILYDGNETISDQILSNFNSAVNHLGIARVWALDTKAYPKLHDRLTQLICDISTDYANDMKRDKCVIVFHNKMLSCNTYNPFCGIGVDNFERSAMHYKQDEANSNINTAKKVYFMLDNDTLIAVPSPFLVFIFILLFGPFYFLIKLRFKCAVLHVVLFLLTGGIAHLFFALLGRKLIVGGMVKQGLKEVFASKAIDMIGKGYKCL